MAGYGGLVELILVACALLGWGFVELRGLQLDKKKAEEAAQKAKGDEPRIKAP